jgi:hypothetical protein
LYALCWLQAMDLKYVIRLRRTPIKSIWGQASVNLGKMKQLFHTTVSYICSSKARKFAPIYRGT